MNQGPSAYHPNALPLGQTGSLSSLHTLSPLIAKCRAGWWGGGGEWLKTLYLKTKYLGGIHFQKEKKTTTEAGVCLQPGLLSSKLCQNGSTTVAHEGGRFFLPTCDPAFGGITGGRGLDWEGGPRHVLSSIFDDDVIDTQVLWCVGHIESSIRIVLDVRTDEGAVWAL